jgi:neocarzinostatin family protein
MNQRALDVRAGDRRGRSVQRGHSTMRSAIRAGCILAAVLFVVSACGSSSSKSASTTAAPATEATTTTSQATTTTAPAQTVTITPSTGLKDGQAVHIVGKGYTAGKQYGVTECADKGNNTGAGDCNLRGIKVATADATGTVTIDYPVAKGPFGSNNIVCSASQACLVSVATAGSANPSEVATANISFA